MVEMDPELEVEILLKITEYLFVRVHSKETYDLTLQRSIQNVLKQSEAVSEASDAARSTGHMSLLLEKLGGILKSSFADANQNGSFPESYAEVRALMEKEILTQKQQGKQAAGQEQQPPLSDAALTTSQLLKAKKNLKF